ncbi:glutamyl-tRNA(Gln) amidotransferase subunit B, mitochondrial [Episyrphus balteatus]|uniref:glutamyl-tRNA(Gln) amidotransferase subunit B, mitochondrial n=1 Tax=Episyrphus balteatus TaxID=286459 RepID=UPI00248613FD|nr:glutamyl-tRNA(Gln) amidotransferase subunit B, mitochondrial [Episyrphus balteatus]
MFKNCLNKFSFLDNKLICHYSTTKQNASSTKWKSVVGLEVHAQILSNSKLFSGSSTLFTEPLNSAVSAFDASIPGTLPVLNRRCVEAGIKTALALNCRVNPVSMFDRKHYFYADLPTGYQITQQRSALANKGEINFPVIVPGKSKSYRKTVRLHQLQLEQDSGKTLHDDSLKRSLVDLNRAGVPLMELVFEPDLETGEEAASLIKELILIFKTLGTCSCKMEEGALRVDANISIHKDGTPNGVRTEVKNIGSVRSIAQAISYEVNRQIEIKNNGGEISNETRSWDAESKRTVAMRDKEVLQDYRFMPEPNLPPLRVDLKGDLNRADIVSVPKIKEEIPDLPEAIRQNLMDKFNLGQDPAIFLVNETVLLDLFKNILQALPEIPTKLVANFLINDLLTLCNKSNMDVEDCKVTSEHLTDILKNLHEEEINLNSARILIEELQENPKLTVSDLIAEKNLKQISDPDEIEKICLLAIEKNPKAVESYKAGKGKAFFAIVGDVAKMSQQKAKMSIVVKKLEELLKK